MAYSSQQKEFEYQQAKSAFQRQLIQKYERTIFQVPVFHVPESPSCDFNDIYVRPDITRKIYGKNGMPEDIEVKSMSEIFTKGKVRQKYIYVVGDAGTGKSFFCKKLIQFWCMAHCEGYVEDEFNGVEEMKNFDFLFYIPLNRFQHVVTIKNMLWEEYNSGILEHLLEKESAKLIILLDGLDEWSPDMKRFNQFQTEGLPQLEFFLNYTIVTTSRPWKIRNLLICENEIDIEVKLKVNEKQVKEMIYKTLSLLNCSAKDICALEQKLEKEPLSSLKHCPLTLKHLLTLWLNDDLDRSLRCSVFASILELFFNWNDSKSSGICVQSMEDMEDNTPPVVLPQYLTDKIIGNYNNRLIYYLSLIAYETLLKSPKEKIFYEDVLNELEIYNDTKRGLVKQGLLSEDEAPNIYVHKPTESMFCFIHRSIQEFLAAIYITINYKSKLCFPFDVEKADLQSESMQFMHKVFHNQSSLDDILELSNVLILLCGLEPRFATNVWKYIHCIASEDPHLQVYRRSVESNDRHIIDLQDLILNSLEECNACDVESHPVCYIGDLIINSKNLDIICSSIDQKQIVLESVRSITLFIDDIVMSHNYDICKYLPMFQQLEKISLKSGLVLLQKVTPTTLDTEGIVDVVNSAIAEMIKVNVSTLKSLCVSGASFTSMFHSGFKTLFVYLPSMINLVALKMSDMTLNHELSSSLCDYLKGTSHLEGISIGLSCECGNQHNVDVLNHHGLKYINCIGDMTVTGADASNIEVFRFSGVNNSNFINTIDVIGTARKLTELHLFLELTNSELFHSGVTSKLITVLPLLHNLSKLNLSQCQLRDNIIHLPSEMKSLTHINLYGVVMNLKTWLKFVDSLLDISHSVYVLTFDLCIAGEDGGLLNMMLSDVKSRAKLDALQYLYKQRKFFIVERNDTACLSFSTKKNSKMKDVQ